MGWNRGSDHASALIKVCMENVQDVDKRKEIYRVMYNVWRDSDWDTVDEVPDLDPVFDELVREQEPEWFEEFE